MQDGKNYILRAAALSLPVSEADALLSAADGTAALIYLHMLRRGGSLDAALAAKELRRTAEEIRRGVETLRDIGLIEPPQKKKLPPADELPEYTAEEVVVRTADDKRFTAVLMETQRIFGRMLSGTELRTLFGIYEHLGIPAEVIILMINHCVERYRERNGAGRIPTMRSIEKEAFFWANHEIITLERAEEHLRRREELKTDLNILRRNLGISDRAPTTSEKKYMEGWLSLGFSPDAIAIAYDRTVTNTGKLAWKYMDTIIQSWHGKDLHSPEEITAGDSKPASNSKPRASGGQTETSATRAELERMQKIRDKIRNGQKN